MKHVVAIGACLLASFAFAKDYGVQSNIWPIVETDVRQMIVESAAATDWSVPQKQIKESAAKYLQSLPKRQLPTVERSQTAYMDPSIILTSDIQAPVKGADGRYSWQVLYPKGTKVNPLDKFRPTTAMLFFDGSQENQVKLVQKVLALEPNRIVVVEAGAGDLKNLNETLKRPVFYANDTMINRFQIRYLPSLVYPGDGAQRSYIAVTSFGLPFNEQEVVQAWPELQPKKPNPIR